MYFIKLLLAILCRQDDLGQFDHISLTAKRLWSFAILSAIGLSYCILFNTSEALHFMKGECYLEPNV